VFDLNLWKDICNAESPRLSWCNEVLTSTPTTIRQHDISHNLNGLRSVVDGIDIRIKMLSLPPDTRFTNYGAPTLTAVTPVTAFGVDAFPKGPTRFDAAASPASLKGWTAMLNAPAGSCA
jgi:hypothetical protein